jgi:acetylornithine/N-succinyldiaminopimelate aminotransferase
MAGNIVNNYGSLPAIFVSGKGAVLYDQDGKAYIDFVAGIGVNCLGHGHPALVRAIQEQAARQIHVSNYYNSDAALAFSDALLKKTGFERLYFGNSGAEANEAAIKLARKYGWQQSGGTKKTPGAASRNVIVTLEKSFHGRTLAALAATGQDSFHPDCFAPYPAGFRAIRAGDFAALETAFDETVCALLIECVQGEGGVNVLDREWVRKAGEAAHNAGALVMVDEVQTGMGRTGTFLACEQFGIEPDAVTLAKGIAGGIPMGACLFRGRARDVFIAGDHQSTFAGNPLGSAAGCAVLAELSKPGFLERVSQAGAAMRTRLSSLRGVRNVRGRGLMIGFEADAPASEVQKRCLAAGLCVSTAGPDTIRFLPPLVITDEEIDKGFGILTEVLEGIR